jgi:hypothetical protein
MASTSACRLMRVEMVTMRASPAARARDDSVDVVGEIREIEMAVAVDEHGSNQWSVISNQSSVAHV